jgi:tetratricopeptide (TPR) repeat protein
MAAVIGRAFDYEILQAAVSLDEMALIDALDELWRRRIIRERANDGYDFSHDRIREVAYQEISRARRRFYHRRVAEALEMVLESDLDDVAGELANHYAQAGDAPAAYQYFRRAATIALERHALRDAELMLDAANLYVPDDPVQRVELLQEQDRVFERALRIERWGENLDAEQMILETIRPSELRLILAFELSRSRHYMSTNRIDLAATAVRRAIHLAEERDDKNALIACYEVLGIVLWVQSRMVEARQAGERMTHYAQLAGDRAAEGRSLAYQAAVGMFSGAPIDKIMGYLQRSLAIASAFDDKFELANIHEKFAYARIETAVGQWTETEQELEQALQYARECGELRQETLVLDTLGRFLIKIGDYRAAEEALSASENIEREHKHEWWRIWVTAHYAGALKMEIGDLDRALPILAEASEQLGRAGHLVYEVRARCDLGFAHHLKGDDEQALSALHDARTMMEGLGELRFDGLVKTRIGYVLEAHGQCDEAYALYEQARELQVQMGQHYLATNALAGMARIERQRGRRDVALDYAATIWNTIGNREADATIETARTLRTCYTVFDAHNDPRADAVVAMATTQMDRRAASIDESSQVERFWRLDDHRFFREQ